MNNPVNQLEPVNWGVSVNKVIEHVIKSIEEDGDNPQVRMRASLMIKSLAVALEKDLSKLVDSN
jgi:hypothetical protein